MYCVEVLKWVPRPSSGISGFLGKLPFFITFLDLHFIFPLLAFSINCTGESLPWLVKHLFAKKNPTMLATEKPTG